MDSSSFLILLFQHKIFHNTQWTTIWVCNYIQAYQQVPLEEESRQYVMVNTQKGLFRYTRLPFGVSSAPRIFQRVMESLMQGIPGVTVYSWGSGAEITVKNPKVCSPFQHAYGYC